MRKYWTLLLCAAGSSCETVVDVDVPFDHPSLVVNALFNADNAWNAIISTNQPILSNRSIEPVDNASVIVYQNDTPIDTLTHIGDGYYFSPAGKPVNGNEYEFRAAAPGFETAIGHSDAPLPALISGISISPAISDGYPVSVFRIRFTDDVTVDNFYEIILQTRNDFIDQETGEVVPGYNPVLIYSGGQAAAGQFNDWDYSILLKDNSFNGRETEVVFTGNIQVPYSNYVSIRLKTLSKDYYKYVTEAQLQNSTAGNPFAQPVNVYNNVTNGFGIIAGYSQSVFTNPAPVSSITSITPMSGKPGDHIIISGKNLYASEYYTAIIFPGLEGSLYTEAVRISETEIEGIIPSGAMSGRIYVYTIGGLIRYPEEFEVIE